MYNHRADIIEIQPGSQNGFLATEAEEYATIMAHIINMHSEGRNAIRTVARYRYPRIIFSLIFLKILLAMVSSINYFYRASVNRFSDEVFEREFLRTIEPFFRQKQE